MKLAYNFIFWKTDNTRKKLERRPIAQQMWQWSKYIPDFKCLLSMGTFLLWMPLYFLWVKQHVEHFIVSRLLVIALMHFWFITIIFKCKLNSKNWRAWRIVSSAFLSNASMYCTLRPMIEKRVVDDSFSISLLCFQTVG